MAVAELVEKHVVVEATQIITYPVNDPELEAIKSRLTGLKIVDKDSYEVVRKGIAECRSLRAAVKERHEELKRPVIDRGRKIDAEFNRITAILEKIEEPLKLVKKVVDDEADRVAREAADAERLKIEAEKKAAAEAEEARLKAIRDAEAAKLAEERKAIEEERAKLAEAQKKIDEANRIEREKIDAERKAAEQVARIEREKLEAERRAAEDLARAEREKIESEQRTARQEQERLARIEREKVEAEQQAVRAEKERLDRIEFERQAKIKADKDAAEKAERDRIAAENKRIADEARRKQEEEERLAEAARIDAMKPDIEKVHSFSLVIRGLVAPVVSSPECVSEITWANEQLSRIANRLAKFSV